MENLLNLITALKPFVGEKNEIVVYIEKDVFKNINKEMGQNNGVVYSYGTKGDYSKKNDVSSVCYNGLSVHFLTIDNDLVLCQC